jgi:hypothetical protein
MGRYATQSCFPFDAGPTQLPSRALSIQRWRPIGVLNDGKAYVCGEPQLARISESDEVSTS